jgi:hypothetical protein
MTMTTIIPDKIPIPVEEEWKTIPDFQMYKCSNQGRIKNMKFNRLLKLYKVPENYITVQLKNDSGETQHVYVHKIIAKTFIPNKDGKKNQVNHINGVVDDNRVENLEWVTQSENIRHAIDVLGKIKGKTRDKPVILAEIDATFKPIPDYEDYKINEKGVLVTKDNIVMKKCVSRHGYIHTRLLNKDGKSVGHYVHRLVAQTFIDNPGKRPHINHKDGNKQNNSVENLEWVTREENMIHAHRVLNIKKCDNHRCIYRLELNGIMIDEWKSVSEAAEKFNIAINTISTCCSTFNKTKTTMTRNQYNGYGWCWKESYTGEKILNPALLESFPEITVDTDLTTSDFDKLRYYVKDSAIRPVWKLELDGTRLELFNSTSSASKCDGVHESGIHRAIKNNSMHNGYGWDYATFKDILNKDNEYVKKKNSILDQFGELDENRKIDFELIRQHLKDTGHCVFSPVWEIDLNGTRIKKWTSKTAAEKHHRLSTNSIISNCKGEIMSSGNRMWERATIYVDDNTTPNSYRVIPYKQRLIDGIKMVRCRTIEEYTLDGTWTTTWNNLKTVSKQYGDVSMSYKTQHGRCFKFSE